MTLKFIPTKDGTFTLLNDFTVGVMFNVKWQERSTPTEILEVNWSQGIETMLTADMCKGNDRRIPKHLQYGELYGITISRRGIRNTLKDTLKHSFK